MNNGINLAFLAQAPALVNQTQPSAQPAGPSSAANQIFANLLMQKMSPGSALSDSDDAGQSLFGQDMSGIANLLNVNLAGQNSNLAGSPSDSNLSSLISALKQQFGKKDDSSSPLSAIQDGKGNDANGTDPMLATWLAALAALQQQQPQLDTKLGGSPTSSDNLVAGIQSQLGGSADARVLKALQQAFGHLNDHNQLPTQTNAAEKPVVPAPNTATANVPEAVDNSSALVVPVTASAAPAVTKNSNSAVQPADARPDQDAMQALAAEMNNLAGSQNVNSAAKIAVPKAESKSSTPAPAVNAVNANSQAPQAQQTVVAPQADAKADAQGSQTQGQANSGTSQQSGEGRNSGDSHKNSQFDQISSKFDVQSVSASTTGQQNVNPAVMQPVAHNVTADQNHTSEAVTNSQPTDIRDIAHLAPMENAAPRTVNQASLMQAASQAEMRVSVKTETAGAVDVRAVLEGNHISATVAAQHSSTREWLVANAHELNQSLSRDDMRLKTFEVTESSLRNDMQGSANGQHQQADAQKPQTYFQGRKDLPFANGGEELETETNGTTTRAISLLA